jgi:hypothetical protein
MIMAAGVAWMFAAIEVQGGMTMKDQDDRRSGFGRHAHGGSGRAACLLIGLAFLFGGCSIGSEFRAAAGPAVETGVNAILDGLVSGLFAVIEPDNPSSDDNSPSGN